MTNDQIINSSSGEVELYTPVEIVELAREVMGEIDLDPASCEIANQVVQADVYYTKEDNGLTKPWFGRVFMNHPFHKGELACKPKCKKKNCIPSVDPKKPTRGHCITEDIPGNIVWIEYLVNQYRLGNISESINITFSSMSETWMFPLLNQLQCFPRGRIHYRNPDGTTNKQATKGSLITYFGPNPEKFKEVFGRIGVVK